MSYNLLQEYVPSIILFSIEIFYQVNPDNLRPHVSDLLEALVCCFKDDSWPVRDGTCMSILNNNEMFQTYPLMVPVAVFTHFLSLLRVFCFNL